MDQPALPPAAVQAAASAVLTQPWPLQAFRPLQELVAVLQALWPLQELAPTHFTPSAANDAVGATIAPAENIAAAAAASMMPEVFFITDMRNLLEDWRVGLCGAVWNVPAPAKPIIGWYSSYIATFAVQFH
jgi:hypothetical protein